MFASPLPQGPASQTVSEWVEQCTSEVIPPNGTELGLASPDQRIQNLIRNSLLGAGL